MLPCPFKSSECPDDDECPHHLERLTLALAQREAQLLEFWKHARDIHYVVTADGMIDRVSSSCLPHLGYAPEQGEGRLLTEGVHPDDVDATEDVLRNLRHDGLPTTDFRNRYQHADGHYVHVEWTMSPLVNGRFYATARVLSDAGMRAANHSVVEPRTVTRVARSANGRSPRP